LEHIENVFRELETYIEVPLTAGMIVVMAKVMAEVLCILAIATEEFKQSRMSEFIREEGSVLLVNISSETFLKKLVRMKDLEKALRRLEIVTMGEARLAAEEALETRYDVGDEVMGVSHKAHGTRGTPKAVEGELQGIKDVLQGVDGEVDAIGDKVRNGA
jgi:hypothetical protein